MAEILVRGGQPLTGKVAVLGAKNAVLKQMVAALLAPGQSRLDNVPGILDVEIMSELLSYVGCSVDRHGHTLTIDVPGELRPEAPLELVRQMRASIVILGPLLARCGVARVALPGGDDLGARPIDMHLEGLEQMGIEFHLEHGVLTGSGHLRGADVDLPFPSVGATENVLLAAVRAEGVTSINNAAREPEIEDLVGFLRSMGASIEGEGTAILRIKGVESLNSTDYQVVPDRLEAGTYAAAAAITGGSIRVEDCVPGHLRMELKKMEEAGCSIERGDTWFAVTGPERPNRIDFATLPFPGFHTDMHPQMVAMLSVADGTSVVTENLYDSRFRYVGELARMGADIHIEGPHMVIRGVPALSGCPVLASDIRAGAALVLAGLRAEGETTVGGTGHIDRGYEDLVGRLRSLGADIDQR